MAEGRREVATSEVPTIFVGHSYALYPKEENRKVFRDLEAPFAVKFVFADDKITNKQLLDKAFGLIRDARFSIFDITDWNPNVTVELGLARGADRDWYIALNPEKRSDAPADLRGIDRLQYRNFDELKSELVKLLTDRFPPKLPADPLAELLERILSLLADGKARSWSIISNGVGANRDLVGLLIERLIADGRVERIGWGRGTAFLLKQIPTPATPQPPESRPTEGGNPPKST